MTEPKHDRWGRYLLPDPDTGEERAWTRASTWSEAVADTYGLTAWKMRMVAKGIATNDDLRLVAAALPLSDKKALGKVSRDAIDAAGGGRGANIGTALHAFTEQLDRGESPEVPAPYDRDVEAYRDTLQVHGVSTESAYIEQIVCVPELGVAGTFDRIVVWPPERYIADVKTGADLRYSWGDIAIQLACYARASWLWNADAVAWDRMPKVNTEQGLVIHLPAGQARCDLWWVDLKLGWEAALLAADVRTWRKRDDIAWPFGIDLLGRSPVQPVLDMDSPADSQNPNETTVTGVAAARSTPVTAGVPQTRGQEIPDDAPPILMVDEPAGPPHD